MNSLNEVKYRWYKENYFFLLNILFFSYLLINEQLIGGKMMKAVIKGVLILFSVIALLSTVVTSQTNLFFSFILEDNRKGSVDSDIFLKMIASENHYFSQFIEEEESSLFSNVIHIATNINIRDVRSLIFEEIPGLYSMTSDIVLAGEGTDFTNLPIESSPPIEELLKEREVVEESLEDLDGSKPQTPAKKPEKNTVFIYHSHNRESFIPHLKDTEGASTVNHKDINITLVGERLGNKLLEKGIGAVIDKTDIATVLAERSWTYGKSYQASREVVAEAISQNNDFTYFLDIHRDSAKRKTTTTKINDKNYAKLYFVVGTGHPNYRKNEQFAIELNNRIKEKYPNLTRGIFRKDKSQGNGVYNQDLSPNSVIIEIGGVENTLEEMYNTADLLAEIFADYYWEKTDAVEVSGDGIN